MAAHSSEKKKKGKLSRLKPRRPFKKKSGKEEAPPPPTTILLEGGGKNGKKKASATTNTKDDEDRHGITLGMDTCTRDIRGSQHNVNPSSSKTENGCFTSHIQSESRTSGLPLQVSLGDSEASDMENDLITSQDGVKGDEMIARNRGRQSKKKATEERELEISASEARSLQKDIPETVDEFEKLVRSSPNSSFVWIKYMALMLSLANVEKARSVAERALRTISIREDGERLNIWVAIFNLENEYGSPPEVRWRILISFFVLIYLIAILLIISVQKFVRKSFQRALQCCDSKKVHLALLGMYDRTRQFRLADELLEKMVRKFRNSCKVRVRCVQNLLNQGKDGVQSVVNRALLSLPQRKHIKFVSQAAILEFKFGVPDRGRSMFEGIMRKYPKRTDIWSVYLDQEIRLGDAGLIRALFERATSSSLPHKKMKFLFKKYLEFENSRGDEDGIEHLKKKALGYVESSLA